MASDRVEDVWLRLKDRVAYVRADFLLRVEKLAKELNITREAAATSRPRSRGPTYPSS